jgi:hypothetical protein
LALFSPGETDLLERIRHLEEQLREKEALIEELQAT